jgi:hypothetical protein
MTIGIVVFLLGLFIVPVGLVWYGHRLRRRSSLAQNAFWGAVAGHCLAGVSAVTLGMIPPEAWTSDETVRGFFGLWSLLVLPVVGAAVGAALHKSRGSRSAGRL